MVGLSTSTRPAFAGEVSFAPCSVVVTPPDRHTLRTVLVGGGTHVFLSKLFPDELSLIPESVHAHEVLAERAAMAGHAAPAGSLELDGDSEKGKEVADTYV